MPNRLGGAMSPYLRSHAGNPVDWYPWGEEAFAEARRRDVPVLVSIGYATCHWCHVMARESFSDEATAAELNARFVSIKVDREEHPEVDAAYLAAASAFTRNLGWPLTVFTTPEGRAFFAGTYFPPSPVQGVPSFRQVLDAVDDAWRNRREQVQSDADRIVAALAGMAEQRTGDDALDADALRRAGAGLAVAEDAAHGGFGAAPKFPMAPALRLLQALGDEHAALASRTLRRMAASPLRDPVEGGFFRYATQADWSEPHYERMLYDNAQLLDVAVEVWRADPTRPAWARQVAEGIVAFLLDVLRLPDGAFASAQDSESEVDGRRSEGGYYALDEDQRARQPRPALDEKVLTGWNGLAIGALAHAGFVLGRPGWVTDAGRAADAVLSRHRREAGLARASVGDRVSDAAAALEDYGALAEGLLRLAAASGDVRYAEEGRALVDAILVDAARDDAVLDAGARDKPARDGEAPSIGGPVFAVPGGGDPVLRLHGLTVEADPAEGAYPSGPSSAAWAAWRLFLLTGEGRYRAAAERVVRRYAALAIAQPSSFGALLALAASLQGRATELVLVTGEGAVTERDAESPRPGHSALTEQRATELLRHARVHSAAVVTVVSRAQAEAFAAAGFTLFEGRTARPGEALAYLCEDFVCRLPVSDPRQLGS